MIYSHGARSLTIWDTEGKPVFDSGSQIAHLLAQRSPETFNSQGSAGSFDNRSDEKGAEPQAIVSLNGRLYAFLGLERAGGVVIYDVTNPNGATDSGTAGDVAPEGIEFVPAQDSPTGMPLLLVANEVSGTTTVYAVTAGP